MTSLPANLQLSLKNRVQNVQQKLYLSTNANGKQLISVVPQPLIYDPSRHVSYSLSPVTSITAGAISNNTPISFRINPGYCGQIEQCFIVLTCRESGGTNSVTPVVVLYMFDRIELAFNGSSSPVVTIYADELYANFQLYNQEQTQNLLAFNQQNMTATAYAGETAIAAGGTAYYSLPLLSVLDDLNPNTIASDVVINVWMRNNPVSAGTGTLQLVDLQFRFLSRTSTADVTNIINKEYMLYTACLPYTQTQQSTQTLTLTAGAMSEIPLNGLNGQCAVMAVMIRASKSVTGSAIRTFASISGTDSFEYTGTINLVDATKQPLLGSGAVTGQALRGRYAGFHAPAVFSSVVPIYYIYFAENYTNAIVNGINSGFLYLNGQQYLQLTPGASFTTGTYVVDTWVWMYACLDQSKGLITKSL